MIGRPEDENDWTDRLTPRMTIFALIACIGVCWIQSLLRYFPLELLLGGLALAGVGCYGIFRGLKWISRRSRPAAVVIVLGIIGVVVLFWPVPCVTQGGKLGTPVRHFCRCEGLTVTIGPNGHDVPITTYCLGLETADVWEEKRAVDIN